MSELLKGYFTVPNDVKDERVWDCKREYIKKYADSYDKEDWKLVSPISFSKQEIPLSEDIREGRIRWLIMAYWDKMPVKQVFEVNEKIIPKLLESGEFTLT